MMRCRAAAAIRASAQPLRSAGVNSSGADKRSAGLGGSGADASSSGSALNSASDSDITFGAALLTRKRGQCLLGRIAPARSMPGASLPPTPNWRMASLGNLKAPRGASDSNR